MNRFSGRLLSAPAIKLGTRPYKGAGEDYDWSDYDDGDDDYDDDDDGDERRGAITNLIVSFR